MVGGPLPRPLHAAVSASTAIELITSMVARIRSIEWLIEASLPPAPGRTQR
jgi:hypothetical protein